MQSLTTCEVEFGHWRRAYTLDVPGIHIEPLANHQQLVAAVQATGRIVDDWLYPPLIAKSNPTPGSHGAGEIYARTFQIASTHLLQSSVDSANREFADLVITFLGFLDGVRLIPHEWVHFYRAAVRPHKLTDLVCRRNELEVCLKALAAFWSKHSAPNARRGIFGAIHWYLFSQSYEHEFEVFGGQYMVLDTCFRLAVELGRIPAAKRREPHSQRPALLAQSLGIAVPPWASVQGGTCELATLRNEYIHEGRYGGEPMGFAYPKHLPEIDLRLQAFNARVIIALVGIDCGYIHSSPDLLCSHGLDLK